MSIQAWFGMAVTALLAGCATTRTAGGEPAASEVAPAAAEPAMTMTGDMCPMHVPGTTVTVVDVEGGVSLAFTTNGGDLAELRQRVRRMADMHNQKHAAGGAMMGSDGPGMMMPAATASVEDTESGATIVLRPADPTQLDALREHARMAAGHMSGGECPMMQPMDSPAPAPDAGEHDAHHPGGAARP